ncbi:DNA polymerase IV [Avibacterium sp. 20-15]|uniref:DNA polymerase IV n=1 Tax=unclassified Avibacterium TaxID=2685287 RepID=UPI0020273BDC|nr:MULTISPECIES: DNA polymerase IV [unclassified Avibacterium]MCW9733827.1 DNA polymerase IV [Avibacterium sp. 20-15]URL05521.1 DNA polymerase IV [Avibacterium sp. 20-132]
MPKTRKIIHIDMDCFYASIELRDKPHLKNLPVAVGGSAEQRGVLSTCNYEARKFGLHSAMPTAQALKRCPNLILLPVNMPLYKQVSQQIQQIFHRYTHLVEPLSLDEAYLDVTGCEQCSGSATWIAQEIRQAIFAETGLTASAGIAPLKFLAKIASDKNKPNGQFVIEPNDVEEFVRNLPLSAIPGVGKVTTQRLLEMGLKTCADVQQFEPHLLLNQLGKSGQRIWHFSHAIDEREVQPERLRKSVGVETTLLKNITELEQGEAVLSQLYEQLVSRVQRACPHLPVQKLRKIGVKLKFDDFQITTLEKSAVDFNQENFRRLLAQIWQRRQDKSIRLIGLHVNLPEQQEEKQMSLWEN